MQPFADNAKVVTIADLEIENGQQAISIHGGLEITRDQAGLKHAEALLGHLNQIVSALKSDPDLPQKVGDPLTTTTIKNPLE